MLQTMHSSLKDVHGDRYKLCEFECKTSIIILYESRIDTKSIISAIECLPSEIFSLCDLPRS